MLAIHAVFAVLATMRFLELFLQDSILAPVRKRLSKYTLFSCARCLSVWAGLVATVSFVYFPWFNWPFALSMAYMLVVDYAQRMNNQEARNNAVFQVQLQQIQAQQQQQQLPKPPLRPVPRTVPMSIPPQKGLK